MKTAAKLSALASMVLMAMSFGIADASAQTRAPDAASRQDFASDAEVRMQIQAMLAEMKPDQGFMWRPLVRDGVRIAALEIWKRPGRPAVHPDQAEYAIVIEGTGILVSGGTLLDAEPRYATLVEGSRIENGTTRALGPGDVILVPAGVPHWFGITGDRLVLLGIKLPGK
ncbi:MAG: cupin domain-containing protein [Sphingomonas sp.]